MSARLGAAADRAGRAAALVTLGMALACAEGRSETPPNVLLYVVDTLRADALGAYDNLRIRTPFVDAFAREGTLFENAFANSSWTRSSVATVLTGRFPNHHGVQGRSDHLPDAAPTLPGLLEERGYTTAFMTTNPNVGSFFGFGRDFQDMIELYRREAAGVVEGHELITPSGEVTGRAIEWIESARAPFFLTVLTVDPHAPYAPPPRFDVYGDGSRVRPDAHAESDGPLEAATMQRLRALYLGEVARNDDSFGRLLGHLRESGRLDDMLVIFTSDHGEEFWEYGRRGHGESLSDIVTRVPLIVRFPARVAAGARVERAVQLVDLLPTVLDLLGIDAPDGLDGKSLFAESGAGDALVFATLALEGRRLRSVRSHPWKLVENRETGAAHFYDLAAAGESRAVASPPPDVRERLVRALEAHGEPRESSPGRESSPDLEPTLSEDAASALRALGYAH